MGVAVAMVGAAKHAGVPRIGAWTLWAALWLAVAFRDGRAWAGSVPPVRIVMHSDVAVRGPVVRLRDVAVVSSVDAELRARVEGVKLGKAPIAGRGVVIARDRLLRWLVARAVVGREQLEWEGAETLRVTRATRELRGDALASVARSKVQQELEAIGWRAEVEVDREPPTLAVPVGMMEMRCRRCELGPMLEHRPVVWVDVAIDGAIWRTVPVSLHVRVWGNAYVVARKVERGATLDAEDLLVREVEVSGCEPLRSEGMELGPLRARRDLEVGTVLSRSLVEPAPEVRAGGTVTVRSSDGNIEIEGRVAALDEGRVGQIIRVRLMSGTSPFFARVKGPGIVEELQ